MTFVGKDLQMSCEVSPSSPALLPRWGEGSKGENQQGSTPALYRKGCFPCRFLEHVMTFSRVLNWKEESASFLQESKGPAAP